MEAAFPFSLRPPVYSSLCPAATEHLVCAWCLLRAGDMAVLRADLVSALLPRVLQWADTSVLLKGKHLITFKGSDTKGGFYGRTCQVHMP